MENKIIIAVDFDGTICSHKFPDIGEPNLELIAALKGLKELGNILILWTCREESNLQAAVEWCTAQGLEFDAINENIEHEFNRGSVKGRKIYAHCYLDDKSIHPETFMDIMKTITKTINKEKA